MSIPLISVLMPAFNARETVAEATGCIRGQTLGDFELIMVNDGSSDDTLAVLQSLARQDARIRVVSTENRGVGGALNLALDVARGKYLARMDADDLTPPSRFAEQTVFLDEHAEITVVGGWRRTFGGVKAQTTESPTETADINCAMLFRNPMSHPTVMMRHEDFRRHHWRYSSTRRFPEDYDLWATISQGHRIANLPRIYLEYRIWPGSVCQQRWPEFDDHQVAIQCRLLSRLGLTVDSQQRRIHKALAFDQIPPDGTFLAAAHAWLRTILERNQGTPIFDHAALTRVLTGRYVALLRCARAQGREAYEDLRDSPFLVHVRPDANV